MLDISIENIHSEISKDSNHSYDVLEEYTPFIPALNQSKSEKNAETLRVVLKGPFCFLHESHMFYLRVETRTSIQNILS